MFITNPHSICDLQRTTFDYVRLLLNPTESDIDALILMFKWYGSDRNSSYKKCSQVMRPKRTDLAKISDTELMNTSGSTQQGLWIIIGHLHS